MARNRFTAAVCLAAAALFAVPAAAQDLSISVGPSTIVEGGQLVVEVESAPQTPVTVDIYVDGRLYHSEDLTSVPGEVTVTLPENSAGDLWEVEVFSGTEVESDSGTIMPSGELALESCATAETWRSSLQRLAG